MKTTILPLVTIAVLAASAPALARDRSDTVEQRIRYDRTQLDSASGRRAIQKRIDFAVNNICGDVVTGSKEEADGLRACRSETRAMARAQMPLRVAARGPN